MIEIDTDLDAGFEDTDLFTEDLLNKDLLNTALLANDLFTDDSLHVEESMEAAAIPTTGKASSAMQQVTRRKIEDILERRRLREEIADLDL